MAEIKTAYELDSTMKALQEAITNEHWKNDELKEYRPFQQEFCCFENIILRGNNH